MKKILFFVLFFSVVVFSPANASQKDADNAQVTMGEIVVTATRDAQEIRKTPSSVSVITEEEINDSGATTLVEVLDRIESIAFRTYSGNSSQSQIDMRGFGGDNPFGKTLILLDGRRLNRTDMAPSTGCRCPSTASSKSKLSADREAFCTAMRLSAA